jgi:hypothetical protein
LPSSVNRSDIIGFELDRQFSTVNYALTSAAQQAALQVISQGLHETLPSFWQFLGEANNAGGMAPLPSVTLTPAQLEPILGGPTVVNFYAAVENFDKESGRDEGGKKDHGGKEHDTEAHDRPAPQETYANDSLSGVVLPARPYPIPAMQIAPVLRYQDVLEIEKSAQHVVRHTARYSKAIWMSLTPEEVAILLDGHTIGVPTDGLDDASQMIPLLNCLQNVVLGTFGNSLIMPFIIPQDLADQAGIDPATLQQALLDYHREAFVSPRSTIGLPTRGVLGEAVLGSCSSAEKIDLTRFWNWQDAPADTAPGIGMVQLPTTTPSLTTGVTAPNSLTNLPPLINNLITAPQPNTSLLQSMGQEAASQPDFSPTFTGQQQLAGLMQTSQTLANQARSDALKTSQTMASQAMSTMANLVGQAMGGQPPPNTQNQQTQTGAKKSTGTGTGTGTGKSGAGSNPQSGSAQQGQNPTGTSTPSSGGSSSGGPLASLESDVVPLAEGAAEFG